MADTPLRHFSNPLTNFLQLESAGGLLLIGSAVLALILSNTGLSGLYDGIVYMPVEVRVGPLALAKPLLLWINDGLMAIFFLLIGLEVKREVIEGELSRPAQIVLPVVAGL